ncbi:MULTISPECIES: thioesterase II family protein [Streptomyces]|uniref:thioesterase II family protein n=1 Tax=Streptomyces TaxID=1883 RepID=UPI00118A6342|nr:alpha/beta fold hydrolase [Streptomyces murinus]MBA9050064.1 surfactin synthase thioesterase subunit [Streptomyces murinus]BBC91687.1 thioesterase [Streptomyces rochei]
MTRNRWTPWDSAPATGGGGADPVRVYCLPHAGGSAGAYLAWARSRQAPGLHFVPVELPGRGTRMGEPPLTSLSEVVDGVLSVLRERPADEPFVLFGHSMGAQIAYETTRRLVAEERTLPRALVVSGCRPPGSPAALPLHDGDDERLIKDILELGGTPAEILEHRELLAMLLPVLRADLTLLNAYMDEVRPTVLPVPVLALGGTDDLLSGAEWVGGWRAVTAGGFRQRVLPGDHFFLHSRVDEVMAEISAAVTDRAGTAG